MGPLLVACEMEISSFLPRESQEGHDRLVAERRRPLKFQDTDAPRRTMSLRGWAYMYRTRGKRVMMALTQLVASRRRGSRGVLKGMRT